MELKHGRITIRSAVPEDSKQLAIWWNDGGVMEHAGFPMGIGIGEDEIVSRIRAESDGTIRRFIIEYLGRAIGEMCRKYLDSDTCEIGIKICDPTMQEQGLGKQILSLFIKNIFEELGFSRIVLDTDLSNARAQHVYERLGFKRISINIDSWTDQLGRLRSSVNYELTPDAFTSFIPSEG